MKLTFLGTRGEIEHRTCRHGMHSSLVVTCYGRRVMIDCGQDWLCRADELKADAIFVTHAHPDHARGLKAGARCPVFATAAAWEGMKRYPISDKRTVEPERPTEVSRMLFEAFAVEHSMRCPAVGYRVTAGRIAIFYAPDVVYIHNRERALKGARVYIGDGATLSRPLVRKRGERLIGHAPIRSQLTWCEKEAVPTMLVTHCGSPIVTGDERRIGAQLREWARERGVEAGIAHDGMEVVLR
jgi:ribonuclease BN (tRNA processing enzyme)